MAGRFIKRPLRRKPPSGTQINWRHPLLSEAQWFGIYEAGDFWHYFPDGSKEVATYVGTPEARGDHIFTASGSAVYTATLPNGWLDDCTLAFVAYNTGVADSNPRLVFSGPPRRNTVIYDAGSGWIYRPTTPDSLFSSSGTAETLNFAMMIRNTLASGETSAYYNGLQISDWDSPIDNLAATDDNLKWIIANTDSGGNGTRLNLYFSLALNRPWSSAEAMSWTCNPYQIFKNRPIWIPVPSAAPPVGRIMSSLVRDGGLVGSGGLAGQGGGLAG